MKGIKKISDKIDTLIELQNGATKCQLEDIRHDVFKLMFNETPHDEWKAFLNEMHEWQQETFGQATPMSKLKHLEEEINELMDSFMVYDYCVINKENNEAIPSDVATQLESEFADCFFLLFGSLYAHGANMDDLLQWMKDKLEVNKKRKWGKPDDDGVVKHIKQ